MEKRLGAFRVVSELGRGGMAVVYQVMDADGGVFALKVPFESDPRIHWEWEVLRGLDSPHIVGCHGYHISTTEDQCSYLKLEYLDGETLESRLSVRGRLGLNEINAVVDQVLQGLQVAHGGGVIHGDLKPANLFFANGRGPRETLKITDFGLSHAVDKVGPDWLKGGAMGTAAYASPEQMKRAEFDHRVDLYALGVILFEMATGLLPWHALDNRAVLRQKLRGPAKTPKAYRPDFPESWNEVILALLSPSPECRPGSVEILRGLWPA